MNYYINYKNIKEIKKIIKYEKIVGNHLIWIYHIILIYTELFVS